MSWKKIDSVQHEIDRKTRSDTSGEAKRHLTEVSALLYVAREHLMGNHTALAEANILEAQKHLK
jgi:hypothetical protein